MPAKVPGSLFGGQSKKEAEKKPEELQQSSNTSIPQGSNTVLQQNGSTALPQDSNKVLHQNSKNASRETTVSGNQPGRNTASPQDGYTSLPQNGITVKQEKATFYLESEKHSDKLDQLCLEYKKRTGRRINRQDVVRRLIENSKLEDLL